MKTSLFLPNRVPIIAALLAVASHSSFAGVTTTTDTTPVTIWPGSPLIQMSFYPADATVPETFTLNGGVTNLAQTFTAPTNCTLYGISLYTSGGADNWTLNLYDLGQSPATPNTITEYNSLITGPNLLGSGAGLPITMSGFAGSGIHHFEFDNTGTTDRVSLQSNHLYAVEVIAAQNSSLHFWRRVGSDSYFGGSTFRDRSVHRADRDFGFAVYTSVTNVALQPVVVTYNPAGSSYGPPPVWPGNSVVSILPTGAGYTDQAFTTTLLGETFLITNPITLNAIHLAGNISANAGAYRLHLYNLGAGGSWTNYGNSFNPSSYPDLLTPVAFVPTNFTKSIISLAMNSANQVVLTNGNYMFALEFVGPGNNSFVWERSNGGVVYTNGTGYQGTTLSASNSAFGAAVRTFIMAVESVPPPTVAIAVSNSPVAGTWPGEPVVRTFEDPSLPSGGTRVPETLESPAGRVVTMSFAPTNDFKLGAVAIRATGGGSTNAFFRVALYHITNYTGYPSNYRPSTEAESLLRTNLAFQLATGSTDDFILMLNFTNALDQVQLYSSNVYAFEISRNFPGVDPNALLWIRGTGANSTYDPWPGALPTPRGYQIDGGNGNTQPYYAAGNLRTPLSGSIRDLVMAVYAAPPVINITAQSYSAGTFTLTWDSQIGTSYTVLKKTNLTDADWSTNATDYPTGGAVGTSTSYTDPATGTSTGFYRVRTP